MSQDLLIIGCGTLGTLVGKSWKKRFPQAKVVAEVFTEKRLESLSALGFEPRLRHSAPDQSFPHVLFCIPPKDDQDYANEAQRAIDLWQPNGDQSGRFVFTSSTAVYAEDRGGQVAERATEATHERAKRLLKAEQVVLSGGGSIVRLAGLYNQERGPHRFFLGHGPKAPLPDILINLVHYDDAAQLCVRLLEHAKAREIYLGCDGHAITRQKLADAIYARHEIPKEKQLWHFEPQKETSGRICDNRWTKNQLNWQPQWSSFLTWFEKA